MALMSTNFCNSAINGFVLVLRNITTFTFTEGMGKLFVILGYVLCSILNTMAGYGFIMAWGGIKTDLNSILGPLVVIFFISLVISNIYFSIYSTAAASILHCFLYDVELSKKAGKEGEYGANRPK